VKSIALEDTPSAPAAKSEPGLPAVGAASRAWLRLLFWLARRAPALTRMLKRPVAWAAVRCSGKIRRGVYANARRIFGPDTTDVQCAAVARQVVGNFYDFVVDVGRAGAISPGRLRAGIESIEGHDRYLAARSQGGGAIVLTAHIGSFEVAMAALRDLEPRIHVVFKRDGMDEFETIRRALRQRLGVLEAPIDDGWETWLRLRDALASNDVIVMQGDRAVAGQKAQMVPILGGHLRLPLGPFKLAQLSRSLIIPVFAVRSASGRCRLCVEEPIRVELNMDGVDGVPPALLAWGRVIEKYLAAYPQQWLVLERAFVEDA
jgi:KDO2-lipid IV(A) lauroyltransferase